MSDFAGVTHRPNDGWLFGSKAACGADPSANPGGVLRMHATDFDCLVCLEAETPPAPVGPCEGSRFSTESDAVSGGLDAGFVVFRTHLCPDGHYHATDVGRP